jgi:hypothetical protein
MRTLPTALNSRHSFTILTTAVMLLAVPDAASAAGTARDHRTPPTVNDHRVQTRDHRAPVRPAKGGGVNVKTTPHKDDAFWP